ncbi:hypothetical protein ACIGEL_16805, partial [Rossellomorea aquimaris]|uniref:hypothetical protein n=1 Tax=Rossellomorea aquimaris TaxID=189382 RepID=UPI0037CB12F4
HSLSYQGGFFYAHLKNFEINVIYFITGMLLGCASGVSPVQLFPQESSTFRYNQRSEYVSLIEK